MKINSILSDNRFMSWGDCERIIEKIESTTEKGDVFEQVCYFYFAFNKDFYQISDIYSNKVPGREIPDDILKQLKLSKKDDGVDGVFVCTDGSITAYQAKFRSFRRQPTSNELNNFWSEAEYADKRLIIANSNTLPSDVEKRKNNYFVLGHIFDSLQPNFFEYMQAEALRINAGLRNETIICKKRPRDYQKPILSSIIQGFEQYDRGKLIAACATGKTLISLWVSELLSANTVLFLAPNLALIRQTIETWTKESTIAFSYIAVCSDITVASTNDEFITDALDIDIPVTTNSNIVKDFLTQATTKKRVIFSTYQSIDVIVEALEDISFSFDFCVFDEAHRTAGTSDSKLFSKAIDDEYVSIKKRLFMTATERLVKPWIKEKCEANERVVFSMDDMNVYGPTFYKLTFGKAISEGIIANYKIVIAAVEKKDVLDLIKENRYLSINFENENLINDIGAIDAFKVALFTKVLNELKTEKAVTFHSSITNSQKFCELLQKWPLLDDGVMISHINGSYNSAYRSMLFSKFEASRIGVISNVRCLIEGVDIPYIDTIYFADPRHSMIDIIQAIGRALRKPYGVTGKTSYIILPLLVDSIESDNDYSTIHSVVQALRDQDDNLAEWIDTINMGKVKGHSRVSHGDHPIQIVLSKNIDYDVFMDNILTRISIANANDSTYVGLGSSLGKKERGSSLERVFKTIGDYNGDALRVSCIEPTIQKFEDFDTVKSRKEIVINNNNVSHTIRLGLITEISKNAFVLTTLGKKLKAGEISYATVLTNQLLLYKVTNKSGSLYPYRVVFSILSKVKTLNYIEFLFGIYSLRADLSEDDNITKAITLINRIRKEFPNAMLASSNNQDEIRNALNDICGTTFSEKDVWTDRTTTGNQYRFLLNHLSYFTDCFDIDFSRKKINSSNSDIIETYLECSNRLKTGTDFIYGEQLWK